MPVKNNDALAKKRSNYWDDSLYDIINKRCHTVIDNNICKSCLTLLDIDFLQDSLGATVVEPNAYLGVSWRKKNDDHKDSSKSVSRIVNQQFSKDSSEINLKVLDRDLYVVEHIFPNVKINKGDRFTLESKMSVINANFGPSGKTIDNVPVKVIKAILKKRAEKSDMIEFFDVREMACWDIVSKLGGFILNPEFFIYDTNFDRLKSLEKSIIDQNGFKINGMPAYRYKKDDPVSSFSIEVTNQKSFYAHVFWGVPSN